MIRRATATRAASAAATGAISATTATATARRGYMPIFDKEAPVDNMNAPRMQDQLRTLWGANEPRVPNTSAAIDFLRRCGINPSIEQKRPQNESIFTQRAEDYYGTNLFVFGSKEHEEASVSYWTSYFEKKYLTAMRMFRRTSTSIVGVAEGKQDLTDEADMPDTVWANDTYFREIAFMAANFLQSHVTSMEEFENKLRTCTPEQYVSFIKVFRYQTLTLVPLPTAACWSYEGEQLVNWANKWKPMQTEALTNFVPILQDANAKHTWHVVADKLTAAYQKVFDVLAKREERQIAAGVRKAWAAMTADERLAAGCAEIDRRFKGLNENTFDAADSADASEEWKAEHAAIEAAINADIGVGFSLQDFWSHVIRVKELEHEHLYTAHSFKVLQGRALEQTRMDTLNGDAQQYYKELLESIKLSSFDAKNGTFIPGITPTWCRLNWVKFGAATITHHTAAARRQLMFHHHTLRGVAALAKLYYKLQPLSSDLDYSSPYRYRQSYAAACASYGVEMVRADHYYNVSGLAKLGNAEEAMGIVTEAVKQAYGAHRRQLVAKVRAQNQRLMPITSPTATILSSSTADAPEGAAAEGAAKKKERWVFGGRRTIQYNHQSPYVADIAKANQLNGAAAVIAAKEAAKKTIVQVALMRKSTPELKQLRHVMSNYLAGESAKLIQMHAELNDVREDAIRFCDMASQGAIPLGAIDLSKPIDEPAFVNPTDKSEWEYVTMIADNIPFSPEQKLQVVLPFSAAPSGLESSVMSDATQTDGTLLQDGEYCLRLRFIDTVANPSCDPSRVVESWTPAFEGYDAVAPVLTKTLALQENLNTVLANKQAAASSDDLESLAKLDRQLVVDGHMLIPVCETLRKSGVEVPLQVEFNAGQVLTPKGQFYVDVLVDLLRGGKFGAVKALNDGLTDVQLQLEPSVRSHWALCNFVGANEEEWSSVRRHVLEDAMNAEAEWWRADDWLESEVEDVSTLPSRQRYADQLCNLLTARGNGGGYDMKTMLGAIKEDGKDPRSGARVVETTATISGDGNVTGLSFDAHRVRENNLSIDELLANAATAINNAQFRLNTLAGRKRHTFCKNKIVATFSDARRGVFGGKYGKTAHFALSKAIEEASLTAPALTIEGGLRDLKPVDRFASSDNPDQRHRTWAEVVNRQHVSEDLPNPELQSRWGVHN